MNQEMSALTNFSLPEYFFRVSRIEDGNDHRAARGNTDGAGVGGTLGNGRYFSEIQRMPWQDI
jgi:hypothetical protein